MKSSRQKPSPDIIYVREGEERDHTLEAKYEDEWVQIMIYPHSLRVVNELIAWRNREDHAYYKQHKTHLYPPYRAKKLGESNEPTTGTTR